MSISVNCSGTTLQNNLGNCLNPMIDYCSIPMISGQNISMPIVNSANFQQFVENYIQANDHQSKFDTSDSLHCTNKYNNFDNLFSSSNQNDQVMCTCNMFQSFYDAYQQQLFAAFTDVNSLETNVYYLLPQCANSALKCKHY